MFRIDAPHLCWAMENLADGHVVNHIVVPEDEKRWAKVALGPHDGGQLRLSVSFTSLLHGCLPLIPVYSPSPKALQFHIHCADREGCSTRMDYKATLNLPKTDFPMKANLPQREPEMLAWWEQQKLYQQIQEAGRDGPAMSCTMALPTPTAAFTSAMR